MIQARLWVSAVMAAISWFAPHAAAQTARADTTFAGAGTLTLPWRASNLGREVVALAPDGGLFIVHEDAQGITVMRLTPEGTPVDSYVGAGISKVALSEPLRFSALHVHTDGSLVIAGGRDLMRVDAQGKLDETFGEKGRVRVPFVNDGVCANGTAIAVLRAPDGAWILVGGDAFIDPSTGTERGCTLVARVRADGTPDRAFGTEGNFTRAGLMPFDAVMRSGGVVEIIGRYAGQGGNWVERVRPEGRMLETFGSAGSLRLADNGPAFFGTEGRILADGSFIFVSITDQPTLVMLRYLADHRLDPMFAGLGRTVLALRDGVLTSPRVLPLADGGFLVRGTAKILATKLTVFYKVDARGFPDRSFGEGGYSRHVAALESEVVAWAAQPDGYVVFTAVSHDPIPPQPPVIPPRPPMPPEVPVLAHATRIQAIPDIVEFRNTIIDHYFLAYDGIEARGIDDGAAGPGWMRTGESFHPGGSTPVCRLYGTPGVGPNSHFFTIEPGECELVKQSRGWTYEGLGFYGTRLVNGACPAGLVTVRRLYNNRAAANDSNHRYVTNVALVPAMTARGWALEGPVFCAKP